MVASNKYRIRGWCSASIVAACTALLLLLPGCDGGPQPLETTGWTQATEYTMTFEQRQRLPDLWAARNALYWQMDGRLKHLLQRQGAMRGLDGYRREVETVADLVEREHDVKVGRVLARSARAVPPLPEWTEQFVARGVDDPVFVTGPTGEVAGLFPIRSSSTCASCHGSADAAEADLQQALASRKLVEAELGFTRGDLIGWYWVQAEAGSVAVNALE